MRHQGTSARKQNHDDSGHGQKWQERGEEQERENPLSDHHRVPARWPLINRPATMLPPLNDSTLKV